MQIKVEIKKLEELKRAYAKAPDVVKTQLLLALRVSLRNIKRRAEDEHRFKSATGAIEKSIKAEVMTTWPLKGRVVLDPSPTMTEGGGSYAYYVHEGTRKHDIFPKNKKCLRWPTANGMDFIFARKVKHPGTKPDPFITNAGEAERENINLIFDRYVDRALLQAGIF